jgi:hypothetical protein
MTDPVSSCQIYAIGSDASHHIAIYPVSLLEAAPADSRQAYLITNHHALQDEKRLGCGRFR